MYEHEFLFSNLALVPSTNMEELGLITDTAASHQGGERDDLASL